MSRCRSQRWCLDQRGPAQPEEPRTELLGEPDALALGIVARRLSLLKSRDRIGRKLKHERHRGQLPLRHNPAVLCGKLDQRTPAQPGRTVHFRIPTKHPVDRILHVMTLNAVDRPGHVDVRRGPSAAAVRRSAW